MTKISLYKRHLKSGAFYYVRFKNADGTWSSAVNSGKTNRSAATAWAYTYKPKNETNQNFFDYAYEFFKNRYAQAKAVFGKNPVSSQMINDHLTHLKLHLGPILGNNPLTKITSKTFTALQIALIEKGLSPQSVVHNVNTASIVMRQAYEDGFIDSPIIFRRVSIKHKHRDAFSIEEARKIFALPWPSLHHRIINLIAATTGMRQSEILGLRWCAVKTDYIQVFATWSEVDKTNHGSFSDPATKAGRVRSVPLTAETKSALNALRALSPWNQEEDFVFTVNGTRPIPNHVVFNVFVKMVNIAGITEEKRLERGLCFHSWRHFYNSALINGNIPLVKVQSIVGHNSARMSENYYHADDMADVRSAIPELGK